MSQDDLPIAAGDRPFFQGDFKDKDGNAIDLTGKVVKFRFKSGSSTGMEKSSSTGDVTILSPPSDGKAEYEMGDGELTEGILSYEWVVENTGGKPITQPNKFKKTIRATVPTS